MNEELKVTLEPQEDSTCPVSHESECIRKPQLNTSAGSIASGFLIDSDVNTLKTTSEKYQGNGKYLGEENLVSNLSSGNDIENQDFVTEESTKTLIKDEELPSQPSTSKIHSDSDVKAIEGVKEPDFNAEESDFNTESSNNFLNEERKSQPTNKAAKPKKRKINLNLTNKEAKNLAVIIKRSDGVPVDIGLASTIRRRVCDNILRAGRKKVDANKFQFIKSGIVDAVYFLVTAEHEESRNWLMSLDLGFYEGAAIRKYRRGKWKKKVPKSSTSGKGLKIQDLGKEKSTTIQDLLAKPSTSDNGLNNQDLDKEESTNALIKEQDILAKPSSSDKELKNQDLNKKESNIALTKE